MYVCSQIFAAAKRRATARQKRAPKLRVYIICFPVHCAGVTNISPRYNLFPAVKICRRHWFMRSSSTNQKELPTCYIPYSCVSKLIPFLTWIYQQYQFQPQCWHCWHIISDSIFVVPVWKFGVNFANSHFYSESSGPKWTKFCGRFTLFLLRFG